MFRPEEYVLNMAFSQSDIKIFEESPADFFEQVIKGNRPDQARKQHYDVGDLTDIFLLQQHLISNYGWIDASPSEGVQKVCDTIYRHAKFEGKPIIPDLSRYMHYLEMTVKEVRFYYNPEKQKPWTWGLDAIKKKVLEEGSEYFKQYVNVIDKGKTTVLKAYWDEAEYLENKFWECKSPEMELLIMYLEAAYNDTLKGTEDYDETIPSLPEHIKILRAYDQYAKFRDHQVKHLGDLCVIDEDAKTTQCFDLKTADSLTGFIRNYWGLGYIKQGALTSYICQCTYPDYIMLPFTFIVIPKNNEQPELFEMSPEEMNAGLFGGTFASGKRYRGIAQSLDDITWHIQNGAWDHKKRYYENGNKNILNSFKDINAELMLSDIF